MSITPITDPNQENEPPILVPLDGGLIDARVIPAYCLNCEKQLSHFFHYKGSRYGRLGKLCVTIVNLSFIARIMIIYSISST